ncbi:MAG TPA: tetratricopeptide repeat protein [Candidatus Sumerlaeota bacterium]|nr:MAG: lipoprotein NlpI [candidate division BRC1 bacterium ADurb.Bin183]HOE62555.1 tetratricopeptide repeat protein [Candidatus Sumerlaeota bacterium]HRR30851.1 tetratricopeptide repeat protein [Candidatus Sumerlaeia bacterium]HON49315.1 tetratricopeptide repeat protein [Candidatus Sumerlaeota bacterium]HOR64937.1 tetratricopeptide repeat protein [Candidatus Sumerlaeota bacterium]
MKNLRPFYIPAAIFILGLGLRIAFYRQFAATPFYGHPLLDELYYDKMGRAVASGTIIQDMAFFMGPLYPYLLGVLYALFGHSADIFRIVQMGMGLGSCGLIYIIGRRAFLPKTGLLAAFIYAAYKPVLFHEQTLLMETSFSFFFLLFWWLLLEKRKSGGAYWIAIGAALGTAALFRGNVLFFFPFLAAQIAWTGWAKKRESFQKIALLAAGSLLGIMPATIHNFLAERDFVPITSNDGLNFYIGNNEKASGFFEPPPYAMVNMGVDPRGARFAEEMLGRAPLKSSEISRFWRRRALEWMKRYPFDFLKLLGRKIYFLWGGAELDQIYSTKGMATLMPAMRLPLFNFFILGPFALLGLFLAARNPDEEKILLALGAISYMLSLVPFFITDRYRIPVIPLMCLFGAYAALHLWDAAKGRRWRECALLAAAMAALFFLLNNRRLLERRQEQEVFHNSLGLIYQEEGRQDDAIKEFKTALSFSPMPQIFSNLGNSYFMKQDFTTALDYYKKAAAMDPQNPTHQYRIGKSCYLLNRWDEALPHFEDFLKREPRQIPEAWKEIAWLYNQAGRRDKAREAMKIYLTLRPNDADAREVLKTHLGGE